MKRFRVTATQSQRSDILGIKRLPANRHLRLLRVISSVCRRLKRNQNRRCVLAVPFLPLSEVYLKAVEAGEVPCRAGKRHPHFLVDCPDVPVHTVALTVRRANRLKRIVQRVTSSSKPRRVVLATNRKRDWSGGKIEQVPVKGRLVNWELIFAGILQVDINL